MSNCKADVKQITSITGTTITNTYVDLRVSPPVLMSQADYDALDKVQCPKTETDFEKVCIQPIGNTDAALIEKGMQCITKTTTFDVNDVPTVAIDSVTLHQADGTDVTATYEETACPVPLVIETGACVA